jgi:hypothetical protein
VKLSKISDSKLTVKPVKMALQKHSWGCGDNNVVNVEKRVSCAMDRAEPKQGGATVVTKLDVATYAANSLY